MRCAAAFSGRTSASRRSTSARTRRYSVPSAPGSWIPAWLAAAAAAAGTPACPAAALRRYNGTCDSWTTSASGYNGTYVTPSGGVSNGACSGIAKRGLLLLGPPPCVPQSSKASCRGQPGKALRAQRPGMAQKQKAASIRGCSLCDQPTGECGKGTEPHEIALLAPLLVRLPVPPPSRSMFRAFVPDVRATLATVLTRAPVRVVRLRMTSPVKTSFPAAADPSEKSRRGGGRKFCGSTDTRQPAGLCRGDGGRLTRQNTGARCAAHRAKPGGHCCRALSVPASLRAVAQGA